MRLSFRAIVLPKGVEHTPVSCFGTTIASLELWMFLTGVLLMHIAIVLLVSWLGRCYLEFCSLKINLLTVTLSQHILS
jgi:hypothetical protein